MNVLNTSDEQTFSEATRARLLAKGLEDLQDFARSAQKLRDALEGMKKLDDENTERRADRMCRQIDTFEPSVTMIGQIKSGKTSLVNALIGVPELLPADVNPWTSVVTSLHLHPEASGVEDVASFQFFDAEEWGRLMTGGGRMGELASRAGADDELEKIKQQVVEMREKSRARLGRKFEVLLGQKREYGYFDKDLIERYVCLGEEPEDDNSAFDAQGRFADITRSADINTQRASLPTRLCIRDTPGVNDTFMMREQITIRAIRDSRTCVVILSAHQALSSTDMALIRLISHVKSRDVIVFVNRIDELSDPKTQVKQIQSSIEATLKKHNGPEQIDVLFGSAMWANFALQSNLMALPPPSMDALKNWASLVADPMAGLSPISPDLAWELSGLPALQKAIAKRVCDGLGGNLLQRLGASAGNLIDGVSAADALGQAENGQLASQQMTAAQAKVAMAEIIDQETAKLSAAFDELITSFSQRMERVQSNFLDRATASLVLHLERYGEETPWTYDPAGLRVLLASSHKVLARKSKSTFETATKSASTRIAQVYFNAFSLGSDDIHIASPRAPSVPAPVSLGRTIALDLSSNWWRRWWLQKRGYKAYADSFYGLIESETSPVISELRDDLAKGVQSEFCACFDAFLQEQLSVFETLSQMKDASSEELKDFVARSTSGERKALISQIKRTLNEYAGL